MGNECPGFFFFFFGVKYLFEQNLKFEGGPMDLKRINFGNEELKSIFFFSQNPEKGHFFKVILDLIALLVGISKF